MSSRRNGDCPFASIAPGSLPGFIAAQLADVVVGLWLVAIVFAVPKAGARA